MNTAVIIDDEQLAIEELKFLLSHNPSVQVVETFTNPLTALDYLKIHPVDVVLLDIQMPMKSGVEVARELTQYPIAPKIIFVTAYDTYAIEAFELNAVDYLLKPTSQKRLNKAINKVIREPQEDHAARIDAMVTSSIPNKDFITLYVDGIFMPIRFETIICCQSDEGGVTIYTQSQAIPFSDTLSALEALLSPSQFFRCHRSYIVNIQQIEKIEPTERSFLLKMLNHETLIPVSRSNVTAFKKIMSIH